MTRTDQRENIVTALKSFPGQPLADSARALFATLGYASERCISIATPQQFCEELDPKGRLTDRERETLDRLTSLHFLFQLTDTELTSHGDLFDDPSAVQTSKINSYVFFAAELPEGHYTRTDLSSIARALNKPLSMPALLLLKHGDTVSLAIIHRRLNKRDTERDVLEKATLIKDIRLDDPIRAHLEILNDFALDNLDADFGTPTFVKLHEAWQKRLSSYALSNDFYREIADWYFWAHHLAEDGTLKLPEHCDTEQEKSLFLIRLLTRVIFCWFLVEKRLIPADLFRDRPLKKLLKDFKGGADIPVCALKGGAGIPACDLSSSYYHAILQNLFFGTLNMPDDLRSFRDKKRDNKRYDPNYGITNLWRYQTDFKDSADWVTLSKRIPFLNGGLFDCLDDKSGKKQDNSILDGFSDNPTLACQLPNDLFFGPERTVDLSKDYGEEDKRTARSKKAKVRGLIEILSRYKFTIEENTPLEEEIALDPELLGKVFENLLASYNEDTRTTARKALGAFYTPREIVSYMVDEALKSYLSTQVPRCKGALDDLFSNKATLKEIKPDTRDALIAAIGRVKILDPACGSGAFPMGALHRLVDLLQKLDPNNESWKRDRLAEAERYRKVLEESGAPKEEIAACDARIEDITKSFDTRFHALDFARKLYLIENGIYGVDIQPVAVQIAKLRFFISLVVDQKVCMSAKNLGVRPLPNLETRLVAADSLIPLKLQLKQGDIFDNDSDASRKLESLRNELKRIRHEHFNARDPNRKRHWRDEDQRVRETMRGLLSKTGVPSGTAKDMSAWDPYDQNTFAPFFDSEWMFGLKQGGADISVCDSDTSGLCAKLSEGPFDIVIANPPYISKQNYRKRYLSQYEKVVELYETTKGRDFDIFGCFIEKGVALLKFKGVLSIIVASGWYTGPAFGHLRRFIACKTNPLVMVNLPYDVFAAAWVDTTILIANKREASVPWPRNVSSATKIKNFAKRDQIITQNDFEVGNQVVDIATWFTAGDDVFLTRSDSNIIRILTQIKDRSCLLEEVADVQRGVTPFDLTDRREHPNSRDAFNGTVRRYKFDRGSKCFLRFDESLAEYKPERYFTGTRILLREMISRKFELQAVVVHDAFVTNKSMQSILPNNSVDIFFLLGCLNSRFTSWFFLQKSNVAHRDDFPKIVLKETRSLPVPLSTSEQMQIVSLIAKYLSNLNSLIDASNTADQSARDPLMLAYFEQILNGLVYELYFSEEVHGARLHLFDLIEQAKLPSLGTLPEPDRLASLRTLFESLYDGTHPLRIALSKLQTLDTVRIIEGKT